MDKKSEKNKYAEVRIEDLHTLLANLPEDPQSLVAVIESLVRIIVADSTSDIQALLSVIESLAKQNAELVEKISELTALVTSLLEQNKKDNSAKSNDSSNSNLPLPPRTLQKAQETSPQERWTRTCPCVR